VLIQLGVQETGSAWLVALYRWLENDRHLARAKLELVAREVPNGLGGPFEIINTLISDGVGLAGLAISYAGWRRANRAAPAVTFEREGVKITVADASEESLRIIDDLLRGAGEPETHGNADTD
jgi:hypothetical protein